MVSYIFKLAVRHVAFDVAIGITLLAVREAYYLNRQLTGRA